MQKVDVALVEGPDGLSASSKLRLLGDPIALSRLHWRVWTSPDAHVVWREAIASARRTAVVVATPAHRHGPRRPAIASQGLVMTGRPAQEPAGDGNIGLYRAADFRLTDGRCADCDADTAGAVVFPR